jgi:hypothetical protein
VIAFLRKLFAPRPRAPARPADPRLAADPWLGGLFAHLSQRYQLAPDGRQVLRRTGRTRFNPMPVWLDAKEHGVQGSYEVRGEAAQARALLDARVTARLAALGLSEAADSTEEWAGTVLTRRYQGRCNAPEQAAAAVRFMCEESELQINLAAES